MCVRVYACVCVCVCMCSLTHVQCGGKVLSGNEMTLCKAPKLYNTNKNKLSDSTQN